MRSRLGFAVAAHLDPEILLIDEALAGGDTKFKERTAEKMYELCGSGRTIVLVTHGLSTVQMMATTALWMHQGKVVEFGDPDDVVAQLHALLPARSPRGHRRRVTGSRRQPGRLRVRHG